MMQNRLEFVVKCNKWLKTIDGKRHFYPSDLKNLDCGAFD